MASVLAIGEVKLIDHVSQMADDENRLIKAQVIDKSIDDVRFNKRLSASGWEHCPDFSMAFQREVYRFDRLLLVGPKGERQCTRLLEG